MPGSPGRIRTYNLFLTETLLLPKGLDYLIRAVREQRGRVYSLYTFMMHRLMRQFSSGLSFDKFRIENPLLILGLPRISPIFQSGLLRKAALLTQGTALPLSYRGSMSFIKEHWDYIIWDDSDKGERTLTKPASSSRWQFAQTKMHLSNSVCTFSQERVYPLSPIPNSFFPVIWCKSNAPWYLQYPHICHLPPLYAIANVLILRLLLATACIRYLALSL